MKNAFYAQSGGVTSVINCSAYGVISKFKKDFSSSNIYASKNGIVGLLEGELYDLNKTKKPLENLLDMPGGIFGSCRYKLPSLEDKVFYKKLFGQLEKLDIGYFFYNGGNDSADTCLKVAKAAKKFGYDLKAIAVPKTIDNDLAVTDNCPGFGSVAKYVAISAKEASLDIKSMCKTSTKVFVLEVMGRHAGWIAAAGELANSPKETFVHKILLPEVNFDEEKFLTGIEHDVSRYGYSVVVASEGLKNNNGELYASSTEKDSFGHNQLGGLAPKIASLITVKLGLKNHWSVADYLQRSARHISSLTDIDQAVAVGKAAVKLATEGKSGVMPIIKRISDSPYKWEISEGNLNEIANEEKTLPKNFISEDGFRITKAGIDYLQPLIQGESFPKFSDGVPVYEGIDLHLNKI
ncbi:MAG: 6-phosphofructokinase [Gammaproteobacteria bacterium TMED112]|nr:MAG: 6-phosphofructokinase [Gammaproteobacteria bacterium TMED112]|tara:strand:- start:17884 stop:19107 length:1224 start_codon:yes stop_codon:yes gene_type:complete